MKQETRRKLASNKFFTGLKLISPLERLIYTSEEIEEMQRNGIMYKPTKEELKAIRKMERIKKMKKSKEYKKGYGDGRRSMVSKKTVINKKEITLIEDERFNELLELICLWNAKKVDGNEFAYRFWCLFNKQSLEQWRKYIESN